MNNQQSCSHIPLAQILSFKMFFYWMCEVQHQLQPRLTSMFSCCVLTAAFSTFCLELIQGQNWDIQQSSRNTLPLTMFYLKIYSQLTQVSCWMICSILLVGSKKSMRQRRPSPLYCLSTTLKSCHRTVAAVTLKGRYKDDNVLWIQLSKDSASWGNKRDGLGWISFIRYSHIRHSQKKTQSHIKAIIYSKTYTVWACLDLSFLACKLSTITGYNMVGACTTIRQRCFPLILCHSKEYEVVKVSNTYRKKADWRRLD